MLRLRTRPSRAKGQDHVTGDAQPADKRKGLNLHGTEYLPQFIQVPIAQRFFVVRLFGSRQPSSGHSHERVSAPGFAEHGDSHGLENASQLVGGSWYVEMVQNRMPPHCVERAIPKRRPMCIGLNAFDGDSIRESPGLRFAYIPDGKIARCHDSAAACEHHRRHAVTATPIENALTVDIAELIARKSHPRRMIEILVVGESQPTWLRGECGGALGRLGVVKSLLALQAFRHRHGPAPWLDAVEAVSYRQPASSGKIKPMTKTTTELDRAAALLKKAQRVAVLTGAGVSAESGIPTFRDANGLWEGHVIEDVATPGAFRRDPKLVWKFYNERRKNLSAVEPNPGHFALAQLELRLGIDRFAVITQNVDGLHRRAGSRTVHELHGNLARTRCTSCGIVEDCGLEPLGELPTCPQCGGLLRPDIVWFHEMLPTEQWQRGESAVRNCDVLLVVGTSAVVYPAAGLIELARNRGRSVIECNLQSTSASSLADVVLLGRSGELLPQLVERLSEME